ncbi:MAG: hypothetical protein KDE45_04650, partial [Caldilineaceae bacterium]|nr:hypothetical protein [Caldilineaceae bacterium]
MLHAYDDAFYLTGINVHEARGVQMAVVYEDPAVDTSLNDDDGLFQMAFGLDETFLRNRDCDFVDNDGECVGDGERDITIDEIYNRWNHPTNSGITENQRWGIPDELRVETYAFAHDDQALFEAGGEIAPQILTAHFPETATPNLLFAQENWFRAINGDGRNLTTAVTWTTNTLAFDFHDETIMATAGYNIAPYRYNADQAGWEPFPLGEYADQIQEEFNATNAGLNSDDPELVESTAYVGTVMVVVTMQGNSAVISTNANSLLASSFSSVIGLDLFTTVDFTDNQLRAAYLDAFTNTSNRLVQLVRYSNAKTFSDDLANTLFKLVDFKKALNPEFANVELNTASVRTRKAFTVFNAIMLTASLASIIAMNFKNGQAAGEGIALAVGAVSSIIEAVTTLREVSAIVKAANPGIDSTLLKITIFKAFHSISSSTAKSSLIGAAIGVAINWIVFFAVWGAMGLEVGSVAFNTLLAQAIAATIVAILMFVVSLTIVGAILVAIISVIDLILTLLGNDFTISGWVTEQIARAIYHFDLTVDSDVQTGAFDLTLLDPARGLQAGRMARVSLPITTTVTHDNPEDPRTFIYLPEYWTSSNLRSTTFNYALALEETSLSAGRGDMRAEWEVTRRGSFLGNPMYRGVDTAFPTLNVEMVAGINVSVPVHLGSAYALPGVECWTIYQPFIPPYYFPVCLDKTIRGSNDAEVGEALVLDIMPATLDAFYALDWGGAVPFPTPLDHDGDGLIARALGGNDPDDSIDQCNGGLCWDSDGDGLGDRYELQIRAAGTANGGARISALAAHTDVDVLCDADEILLGTLPYLRDTDGDVLTDGEEVWHQDRCDNNGNGDRDEWLGGWDFTAIYTDALGITQTLTTRINSDPLNADVDGDGLTDLAERTLHALDPVAYPFNPHVFNESPLAVYLALGDADRIVAPGQTVVLTTTVQNNLSSPLYALGGVTVTLPAVLGGGVLTRTYNLFQGESAALIQDVTVSSSSTVQTTVGADFMARLHDGNTAYTWEWEPPLLFDDKNLSAIYPRQATLAALPGAVNDYALVTLEGGDPATISTAEPLIYANPQGRQATGIVGGEIGLSLAPSGLAGSTPPAIAANSAAETLTLWSNAHWYNCAEVYVDRISIIAQGDQSGGSEYYINRTNQANTGGWNENFSNGWGERLWADPIGNRTAGTTVAVGQTFTLCEGDVFAIWEDDGTDFRADDYVCAISPLSAASSTTLISQPCADGGDTFLTVYFHVIPDPNQDWLGRDNYNCAEVYLESLTVLQSDDHNGASEYYINLNGHHLTPGGVGLLQNPAVGTRIWTDPGSANSGDTRLVNVTYPRICRGDTLDVWEDDSGHSLDDSICSLNMLDTPSNGLPAATAAGVSVDLTCNGTGNDNDRLVLRLKITPNPKYMLAGALLNADGTVKQGGLVLQNAEPYGAACVFGCLRTEYRAMLYPAAASDGTNFLAAWQNERGQIRFRTVTRDGVLGTTRTLPGLQRSRVDLAWTGTHYLAVWENLSQAANGNIEMVLIDQNGVPQSILVVANAVEGEYQPRVAYDPVNARALVTYLVDLGGGSFRLAGRFVEGTVISPEFNVAAISLNPNQRPVHDLAYDATNQTWLAAWDYHNSTTNQRELHYQALAADGTPLLPAAAGASTGGATPTQLSVACSDPNAVAPNCALLTVSDTQLPQRLRLSRVFLRSVAPWLGEISGTAVRTLTVDADAPTSSIVSLTDNQAIALDGTLIIGGSAQDPTSNVAAVEVSINNGPWQPASGAETWSFAWTPGGEGAYTLRTRATDVAGNRETAVSTLTVYVDNTPPQLFSDNTGNPILAATQDADGRWRLSFSGTAANLPGGLTAVAGRITPNGDGWQPAVVNGGQWTLDYTLPLIDADGRAIVDPGGAYTLLLRARDGVGNQTPETDLLQVPFRVDAAPPQAALGAMPPAISQTLTLNGVITDPGSVAAGVQGLAVDLVPAGQITNSWQTATLLQSGPGVTRADWEYTVPAGLEGYYLINLRGTDVLGNRNDNQLDWWSGWQGEIDTLAPR